MVVSNITMAANDCCNKQMRYQVNENSSITYIMTPHGFLCVCSVPACSAGILAQEFRASSAPNGKLDKVTPAVSVARFRTDGYLRKRQGGL